MTRNMEQRVVELEKTIQKHEEKTKDLLLRIESHDRQLASFLIVAQKDSEMHKSHRKSIQLLDARTLKYDDVYYHVFPERVKSDNAVFDQLAAIKAKSRGAGKAQE